MAAGARLSHSCAASCSGGARRNLARSRAGFHCGRRRTAEKPRGVSAGPAQPGPRGLRGRPAGGVGGGGEIAMFPREARALGGAADRAGGVTWGGEVGARGGGSAELSRHLVGSGGCAAGAAGSAVGPGLRRRRRSVSAGEARDGPGAGAGAAAAPPACAGPRSGGAPSSRPVAVSAALPGAEAGPGSVPA